MSTSCRVSSGDRVCVQVLLLPVRPLTGVSPVWGLPSPSRRLGIPLGAGARGQDECPLRSLRPNGTSRTEVRGWLRP